MPADAGKSKGNPDLQKEIADLRGIVAQMKIEAAGRDLVLRALLDAHPDRPSVAHWLEVEARKLESHALNSSVRDAAVNRILDEIQKWTKRIKGE